MLNLNSKKKRIIVVLFICISIIFISFFYKLLNKYTGFAIPCLFHEITGLYCPGCGMTRAIFSLLELEFKNAIRYNPLIIILFPIILIDFIISTKNWINQINKKVIPNFIWNIILIITIIFGILRNISYFDFLRPM